jgi:pimeloyl-ACP methyl ester carboxylesterase
MSTVSLGEGRPIVFLHGDIGQAYMWRNVMPYAAQAGRAIGVDLIGMGDSDKLTADGLSVGAADHQPRHVPIRRRQRAEEFKCDPSDANSSLRETRALTELSKCNPIKEKK